MTIQFQHVSSSIISGYWISRPLLTCILPILPCVDSGLSTRSGVKVGRAMDGPGYRTVHHQRTLKWKITSSYKLLFINYLYRVEDSGPAVIFRPSSSAVQFGHEVSNLGLRSAVYNPQCFSFIICPLSPLLSGFHDSSNASK